MPVNRNTSVAGALDTQFGVSNIRSIPVDFFVVLTSAYDFSTGYSWEEIRGVPGSGFVTPPLPLTGNLAYDIAGNINLLPGTICRMSLDRDQTVYGISVVYDNGGGTGSGSGSGSGTPVSCDNAVQSLSVTCDTGSRVLTSYSIGIGLDGNTLITEQCDSTEYNLGPCSPSNPSGSFYPFATKVCPVLGSITTVTAADSPYTPSWDADIIHVDATDGEVDIILPDPLGRQGGGDQFIIKKVDSSGNSVVISSLVGNVEFAANVTFTAQGDAAPFYHDGASSWFVY